MTNQYELSRDELEARYIELLDVLRYCQAYFNGRLHPQNNHPSILVENVLAKYVVKS
jgi:hypothetical protein